MPNSARNINNKVIRNVLNSIQKYFLALALKARSKLILKKHHTTQELIMLTLKTLSNLKLTCLGVACFGTAILSANTISAPYSEIETARFDYKTPMETSTRPTTPEREITGEALAPTSAPTEVSTPSQRSINDVVSYYYGSETTPVLADYKLCTDIGTIGNERNQCIGELSADSLTQGQTVYLWMNYLVPKGTQSDLLLHYNHNGITRDASNLKVSGSIRFRTWKKIKLSRSGDWELPIYVEQGGEYTELDRITLNVKTQSFAGL